MKNIVNIFISLTLVIISISFVGCNKNTQDNLIAKQSTTQQNIGTNQVEEIYDIFSDFTEQENFIMGISKKAKFGITIELPWKIKEFPMLCIEDAYGKELHVGDTVDVIVKVVNLTNEHYICNFIDTVIINFWTSGNFGIIPEDYISVDKTEFEPYEIVEIPTKITLTQNIIDEQKANGENFVKIDASTVIDAIPFDEFEKSKNLSQEEFEQNYRYMLRTKEILLFLFD